MEYTGGSVTEKVGECAWEAGWECGEGKIGKCGWEGGYNAEAFDECGW